MHGNRLPNVIKNYFALATNSMGGIENALYFVPGVVVDVEI